MKPVPTDDFETRLASTPTMLIRVALDPKTPKHLRLEGERAEFAKKLLAWREQIFGEQARCPNCGEVLTKHKCKLTCKTEGCGFFLSCGDFE